MSDNHRKRPNIVMICADQLRQDGLGCTGNPVARTPNIDRIVARGASLDRHFAACTICAPSRSSMFSGLYPRNHGLVKNGLDLPPSVELFSHVMMDAGVATHAVGKLHFQPILASASYAMPESNAFWSLPQTQDWVGPYYGFQTTDLVIGESFSSVRGGHYGKWVKENHPDIAPLYLRENALDDEPDEMDEVWRCAVPAPLHYNSWIADRSVEFLETRDDGAPFFLFISFPDPHHPFAPPAPYCDNFDPSDMPMPRVVDGELDLMPSYVGGEDWGQQGGEKLSYREFLNRGGGTMEQGSWQRTDGFSETSMRKIIAYTNAMVQMIDDGVGKVLSALDSLGLSDNTYVIMTSDHGELLGDHGLIRKGPMAYRELLQVPFLCAGPGIAPGTRIEALTSHIDVKDTLLDLMGLAGQPGDGLSIKPLLEGSGEVPRDHVFAEYYPRVVDTMYNLSVITQDARLTLYPVAEDDSWGEFFDTQDDPGEHTNRFNDPSCENRISALASIIADEFPPEPKVHGRVLGPY